MFSEEIPGPVEMFYERFRLCNGYDPRGKILDEARVIHNKSRRKGPMDPFALVLRKVLVAHGFMGNDKERILWEQRQMETDVDARGAEVEKLHRREMEDLKDRYERRLQALQDKYDEMDRQYKMLQYSKLIALRGALRNNRTARKWITENVEDEGAEDFKIDLRGDIEWVYRNIDRCTLADGAVNIKNSVGKAPTSGALAYLSWAAQNRDEFLRVIVPKILSSGPARNRETPREKLNREMGGMADKRVLDLLAEDDD